MEQESKNKWLMIFAGIGALSGLVAVITYYETRNKRQIDNEIAALDRNIKSLQLKKLQSDQV